MNHAMAHQTQEDWVDPGPGDLMHHCVTCPRPSGPLCNMPAGWKNDPNAWAYQYQWNIDGNFVAQHTASRLAENNVFFFPGTAMYNHPDDEHRDIEHAKEDNDLRDDEVRTDNLFVDYAMQPY